MISRLKTYIGSITEKWKPHITTIKGGVMVIVVGNGHEDTSSNPGPG